MTAVLAPIPFLRFTNTSTGLALIGGQVFTYAAGTTTPQTTYTDSTGTVANTNPIILNARGECVAYLNPALSYKFVIKDSLGNTISTYDGISSGLPFLVNVKNYGAKGDGTTDDTAAMAAAHATGRLVYYPAGTYIFSTLSITAGGIVGEGKNQTILNSTDATSADAITVTSARGALFRDFGLGCPPAKTSGGAALHVTAPAEVDFVTIDGISIINCYIGVQFTNVAFSTMTNSSVFNAFLACALIEAPANPDLGDSTISECSFEVLNTTGRGILHKSGGGWRINNTKVLGGLFSYSLEFTGTTNSSDLFLTNCSLEGASSYAISLARTSGTFVMGSIQIVGCEIGSPSGITTDTSGVVTQLVISSNNITISGATAGNVAINLQNVPHFTIGPNVLNSAGGSAVGVLIDANCSNGKIAPQTYVSFVDANCLVNASASVYAQRSTQTGTANLAAAGTAHGSLWRSTVAVTFPVAYKTAPIVECYPGDSANSQVGCYPTSITKTGFTLVGVASTLNAAMNNNVWVANGII